MSLQEIERGGTRSLSGELTLIDYIDMFKTDYRMNEYNIHELFVINHGLYNVRNWGLTVGRGKVLLLIDSIKSVSAACLLSISYWK
jgi:hypothetical protein